MNVSFLKDSVFFRFIPTAASRCPFAMTELDSGCCVTCGPGMQVVWSRLLDPGVTGVSGVTGVGPHDGGLLQVSRLVSNQQQLEVLVSEEGLQEVQVQSRHSRAVHCQDLVSSAESLMGHRIF